MKKVIILAVSVISAMNLFSCKDEDEKKASIHGRWQGTVVQYSFTADDFPIPISDEQETNYTLEIREDGTATVDYQGTESSGQWEYGDNKSNIIVSADFPSDFTEPTETFTIKTLSSSNLTLYLEKSGLFDIPDVGEVAGTVELTFPMTRLE